HARRIHANGTPRRVRFSKGPQQPHRRARKPDAPATLHRNAFAVQMNPTTYTFGSFRLDTARRLLFSGNEITPLPERAFQLLLLLIEAAGGVVSKDTLAARVWPESTVSDANLSQHVYLLRRMLREKATDRSYIMT